MKYEAANKILPRELVEEIQKYTQGMYIYIPKEESIKKSWGENSGAKKNTERRNAEIREKFIDGISKEVLAEMYCLSISSIKKIVYRY